VPSSRRAPIVALLTLLQRRFPGLDDPDRLITEGAVLIDGVPAASPRTRVRADAAIRIRQPRPLRGTIKLAHALASFGVNAAGAVALDLGAAAGGFTQALLDAGAARVYAVDAGAGQLRGWLRADPRVISLERTNLARLSPDLIGERAGLVTMDLPYLAVADAIGQLDRRLLAPDARLIALVKPTFELHAAALADQPDQVSAAVAAASRGLDEHGWKVLSQAPSPDPGRQGSDRGAAVREIRAAVRVDDGGPAGWGGAVRHSRRPGPGRAAGWPESR
jgi:23S rRNA (cytidine1920-2'-O)/16S rRNA (cytidine1409-2'-O)-methyltransferase